MTQQPVPLRPCRWRDHRWDGYVCHSPKFVAPPNRVTQSFCGSCTYVEPCESFQDGEQTDQMRVDAGVHPRRNSGVYLHPEFTSLIPRQAVRTILELGSGDALDAICLSDYYDADVYAFECHPESLLLCSRNIAHNSRIHLVPNAVWNQSKTLDFHIVVNGNVFASSCFLPNSDYPFETYKCKTIQIEATRLDHWLASQNLKRIDLLCIDLQGACLQALEGMGTYLDTVQFIIAELEIQPIYHGEALHEEVSKFLFDRGFEQAVCIRGRLDSNARWQEVIDGESTNGLLSWYGDFLFLRTKRSALDSANQIDLV